MICGYVSTKWVPRMEAKSSGGVTGFSLALMYTVFFMESVATTTLLSAFVYLGYLLAYEFERWGWEDIVRYVDSPFEEYADSHLSDGLDAGFLIAFDFIDADVVLAISGCCY